jgi:large subunit ribosomal protein L19e
MKLDTKKQLAAQTLGVGKDKVIFNTQRLADIAEALTKQDIRDLVAQGAILVRAKGGRKTIRSEKKRRRPGSVRKKVKNSKQSYMIITRKLRSFIKQLQAQERITHEQYLFFRKEIRAHRYKSKSHFKEREHI